MPDRVTLRKSTTPANVNRFLDPGERVVLLIPRRPIALCLPLSAALGGLLAAIAVSQIPGISSSAQLAVWILVAFLMARLVAAVLGWTHYHIIMTDRRLLIVSGIFNLEAASSPLPDLAGIKFRIPIVSRLFGFGYGTLTFSPAGGPVSAFDFIPSAEKHYYRIRRFLSGEEDKDGDD
jgi:hypothetical protein